MRIPTLQNLCLNHLSQNLILACHVTQALTKLMLQWILIMRSNHSSENSISIWLESHCFFGFGRKSRSKNHSNAHICHQKYVIYFAYENFRYLAYDHFHISTERNGQYSSARQVVMIWKYAPINIRDLNECMYESVRSNLGFYPQSTNSIRLKN